MVAFITVFLLGSITAVFVSYIYYKYVYKVHKSVEKIPGPKPHPIVGTAFEFKGSTTELLDKLMELKEKHGPVYKLSLGVIRPTRVGLVISDPTFLEFVMSSQRILTKTPNYRFLHRWLQYGLLTSTGSKWKQRRRIITPTFHFQILEQFIDVFNSAGEILIEKLQKEVGKESVNIYSYITLCALDIICESAMGTHVNAQNYTESKYVNSVKEMCRILVSRSFSVLKMFDGIYPFFPDFYKELKAIRILHNYSDTIINKRRQELMNIQNEDDHEDDDIGVKKRHAFLDLLLKSTVNGKPLTHEDIREEVDTFVFEGHDTTASAMSFTLYCLANHQDVQQKALQEINKIFEDDPKRPATYKDLQEMKYLEMVIKESLRLYPSVPFYGRELEEDMEYVDGTVLSKGVDFLIFAYGIHRDPKIWPEPEKFDPNRFLLENSSKRHPFAYIPFSAGPRNCIGQKFAMLEMKSTVSKVLRNFEVHPAIPEHKIMLAAETVLKSANGIRIRLKKRNLKTD